MKRIDKLSGLKAWWNKYCKPKYKITMPADKFKEICLSEYVNTGSVEMCKWQSKDGTTHNFTKY